MRIPKGKSKLYAHICVGGPWCGQRLMIPFCGTMVFKVGEHHGHYSGTGHWRRV